MPFLDAAAALALLPCSVARLIYLAVSFRLRPDRSGNPAILHLSGESSHERLAEKFGSMDFLFAYDGSATAGLFARVIMHWFPAPSTRCISYENGWVVSQQSRRLSRYALTGLLLYTCRAATFITRENVAVIRCWDPFLRAYIGWFLAALFGLPFCISIHADYDKYFLLRGKRRSRLVRALELLLRRFILSRARYILPIREHLRKKVMDMGFDGDRVRVIPHGIDLRPFTNGSLPEVSARLHIPPATPLISFAGRFSKENYLDDMHSLIQEIGNSGEPCVFVLAGGGPEEPRFRNALHGNAALARRVVLPGFLTREECMALRKASCVSLCLMGGFSLIEACAAGRPVISYDVDWHGELVISGETGFLVAEHDIPAVAAAIRFLLDHPLDAARMGENARNRAFQRHDLEVTAGIKRRCYADMLRKSRRHSRRDFE